MAVGERQVLGHALPFQFLCHNLSSLAPRLLAHPPSCGGFQSLVLLVGLPQSHGPLRTQFRALSFFALLFLFPNLCLFSSFPLCHDDKLRFWLESAGFGLQSQLGHVSSCVTLGRWLDFSVPWVPELEEGTSVRSLLRVPGGRNEDRAAYCLHVPAPPLLPFLLSV